MHKIVQASALALALLGTAQAATAVTTTTANLRRAPSMSGPVVAVVPQGRLLTVACQGNWCRTTFQGRGGYMARTLLRPVTNSAPLAGEGTRFFATCQAMRRAGVAPLRIGNPGYRVALDPNHNGWACDAGER
ncbi:SH3 domain-containing protein [Deinococcus sp. HMF7620]|uniref:SH3 domain-containing protein n=1 Tax=Deinococcus arboris TaxID=2682977 RepID=A0A7C9HSD0_9DEIO|nr:MULTISPECIES: excalibur calcium-binding domain-containing protein [Deinococcus]MBZ9750582.1 excalibur calcium-binding domain-containing protein [Deinococcus betulae]MVN87672.1 SH3 domain-containing protein [Deinococcus arboris]